MITLYVRQLKRQRCIEQSVGLCGRKAMTNLDSILKSRDFAAASATKSLLSCPTLCSPIDGNPLQYSCLENPMGRGA